MVQSISNPIIERKDIRRILHDLAEFYKHPTKRLVSHLRSQGYTYKKIGDIMEISGQAVEDNYAKE